MAAQRKATPIRGIIIFVVLVMISGLGLYATDNLDGPVGAIARIILGGSNGGDFGERGAPPDGNAAEGTRPERGGDFGERGGENGSVNWSQFGSVLFNLWFIAAVTAALIVAQQVFSFVVRWWKRRSPRVAPAG